MTVDYNIVWLENILNTESIKGEVSCCPGLRCRAMWKSRCRAWRVFTLVLVRSGKQEEVVVSSCLSGAL